MTDFFKKNKPASQNAIHAVDQRTLLKEAGCHPITLRFPKKLEKEYLAHTLEANVSFGHNAVKILFCLLPFWTMLHGWIISWDFPRATVIGYIIMICIGLTEMIVIRQSRKTAVIEAAAMILSTCLALAVMMIVLNAPLPRRLTATTTIFGVMMFMQGLPLRLTHHVFMIPLVFLGFLTVFSYTDGVVLDNIIGLSIGTSFTILIALILAYQTDKNRRLQFLLIRKVDGLLRNTLPDSIVDDLTRGRGTSVKRFDESTVLFADIVGFTSFAMEKPPEELVKILNDLFSRFDAALKQYPAEKIKTIGDAYMIAVGIPKEHPCHLQIGVELAMDLREAVRKFARLTGVPFTVRIGLHTGPVVAGIIGHSKFLYDLWGDTVNIASRMEATGVPGEIQVTKEIRNALDDLYEFTELGEVDIKGRGPMTTYLLKRPRDSMIFNGEVESTAA